MRRSVSRWARAAGAALIFGAALGSAGCSSAQLFAGGPFREGNVKDARRSAARYFLAKDILLVEAEIRQSRVTTLRAENDGAGHFTFGQRTRVKFDSSVASITPKTVPDTSAFFQVELASGDASEDNVTVEVTDQGLLRAVNATSASKAGEIVKNVAQVAATVAAVAGVLGGRDPGLVHQVQALFDKDAQSIPRLRESLSALPIDVLYLLHEQPDARALWANKLRLEALLEKRRAERDAFEDAIQKLAKADVETRREKIELIDRAIARIQAERQGTIDALASALQRLSQEKHLAPEPITRKIAVAFELEEIPGPSLLDPGMDPVEVKAKLVQGNFPKMAQLFEDAGIVFTLSAPPVAEGDPNAAVKSGASAPPDPAAATEGRFYFRQSYPLVLRSFAKATLPAQPRLGPAQAPPAKVDVEARNKGAQLPGAAPSGDVGEKEQIRLVEERVLDLIPASAPALYVSFAPKEFATRRLALSFDAKGRLARLERSGTSALAGETAALAEGVTRAHDEYATTMERLVEIQDARRQLSLADLQGQIDRVEKQRELIDAKVSLAGADATADLTLQRQRLDAEIGVLQARAAYESQRGTIAQVGEIDQLKARLDQLTAEVAALRARLDATKTTVPGGP